jgi:hypothetical protein
MVEKSGTSLLGKRARKQALKDEADQGDSKDAPEERYEIRGGLRFVQPYEH